MRDLNKKLWDENKAANAKAKEIAIKMKEARALAKTAAEAAKEQLKVRNNKVKEMLGEAREKAWELAKQENSTSTLGTKLVDQSLADHNESVPIETLAATFCSTVEV